MEQKKVPLKTIFKKVKNGDDGSNDIYMIKGANETERVNSDVTTDITEQNADNFTSNAPTYSSQIPDFITEEIAALINCSDLASYFNFSLDNNAPDEALALLNLYSSAPVENPLTTTDNSAERANALHNPFDESTQGNRSESSTLNSIPTTQIWNNEPLPSSTAAITTPTIFAQENRSESSTLNSLPTTQISNNEPLLSSMAAIPTPICSTDERNQCESSGGNSLDMTLDQCEIPVEDFTTTNSQNVWMAGDDLSSATSCNSTRFDEETINEIFPYAKRTDPPVKVLQDILRPRQLIPLYRFRWIPHSIFQCHVVVNGLDASGTGTSKEYARNVAALSLLDKLVSTNFFGNVIGRLQEFCATIHWPLPKYTDEMAARTLIKNEYVFIVVCSVKQYSTTGQGRSKKMAKIFAAYKMWYKLTGRK
ncbi:hypothetical protein HA402_005457 [Bradysia odoriphaga]|nr:hypothetical protein HA402_005457 [Bradysia odoriphaga]